VYRISSKRSGELKPTPLLILTFATPNLPEKIIAGINSLTVRPHIQNPLRCYRCQRFGHSVAACNGTEICGNCAANDHKAEACKSKMYCANCKGEHTAWSRECPKFKQEKGIQEIKTLQNISIQEARKLYSIKHPDSTQIKSYAQATTHNSIESEDIRKLKSIIEQQKEVISTQAEQISRQSEEIITLTKCCEELKTNFIELKTQNETLQKNVSDLLEELRSSRDVLKNIKKNEKEKEKEKTAIKLNRAPKPKTRHSDESDMEVEGGKTYPPEGFFLGTKKKKNP
jgi:hypothetical protein